MILVFLFVGCLPSFLQIRVRNFLGGKINSKASIGIFSIILTKNISMDEGAKISSFVLIKSNDLKIGKKSTIRPFSVLKVFKLEIGKFSIIDPLVLVNCSYKPKSILSIGNFSRVFSFSVLEPSEGIFIGNQTGLGGQTLIFCHGSWPNYLKGAPYNRAPVKIGNGVWIPWRVMILPGTVIEDDAIVGAHSLVRGQVTKKSLFSGVPAKLIKENCWQEIDIEERNQRLQEIIRTFREEIEQNVAFVEIKNAEFENFTNIKGKIFYTWTTLPNSICQTFTSDMNSFLIDLESLESYGASHIGLKFVEHMSEYGIRLAT